MSFTHQGRTLTKVAVIGSGQIGPDIALFFSKVLSPFGVPDGRRRCQPRQALENGRQGQAREEDRSEGSTGRRVHRRPAEGRDARARQLFTNDYSADRRRRPRGRSRDRGRRHSSARSSRMIEESRRRLTRCSSSNSLPLGARGDLLGEREAQGAHRGRALLLSRPSATSSSRSCREAETAPERQPTG